MIRSTQNSSPRLLDRSGKPKAKKSRTVSLHQVQVADNRDYWSGAEIEEIIQRIVAGEKIADVGDTLDVMVDPETARVWIGRSKHNRRTSVYTVEKYAADMDADRWLYTHQGIAFDCEGHLIDGYHRLMACTVSCAKFPTQVTLNLPVGTGLAVDQGKARSVSDVATLLTGTQVSTAAAAVTSRMIASTSPKASVTRTELVQFLQKYRLYIEESIRLLPDKSPGGRCGPRAVVARALITSTENTVEIIKSFCEVLVTGKYSEGPEYGVFLLREWLMKNKHSGAYALLESYRRTSGALTAYLKGKSVLRLSVPTSEQFKLPGEE